MTDANGDVPLQSIYSFKRGGSDSDIHIPIEFDFQEDVTVYHAFSWIEALAGLGGVSVILKYLDNLIKPLILLVFMLTMA